MNQKKMAVMELRIREVEFIQPIPCNHFTLQIDSGSISYKSGLIELEMEKFLKVKKLAAVDLRDFQENQQIYISLIPYLEQKNQKLNSWISQSGVRASIKIKDIFRYQFGQQKSLNYPIFSNGQLRGSIKVRVKLKEQQNEEEIQLSAQKQETSTQRSIILTQQGKVFMKPIISKQKIIISAANFKKVSKEEQQMDLATKFSFIDRKIAQKSHKSHQKSVWEDNSESFQRENSDKDEENSIFTEQDIETDAQNKYGAIPEERESQLQDENLIN